MFLFGGIVLLLSVLDVYTGKFGIWVFAVVIFGLVVL
jgi:hypothetical protein